MGATSVTGAGPGDSGGKQKPKNHCGCSGCGHAEEPEPKPPVKRGCVTRYVSGKRSVYRSKSGTARIRVC